MTWPGRVSPWDGLRLPLGLPENRDGEGCAGRQVPGRGRLTLASLPPRPTGGSRYLNVGKSARLQHYCQGLTCYLIECHILKQYLWECLFKWSWGQLRAPLHIRGLLWNSKKALDITTIISIQASVSTGESPSSGKHGQWGMWDQVIGKTTVVCICIMLKEIISNTCLAFLCKGGKKNEILMRLHRIVGKIRLTHCPAASFQITRYQVQNFSNFFNV